MLTLTTRTTIKYTAKQKVLQMWSTFCILNQFMVCQCDLMWNRIEASILLAYRKLRSIGLVLKAMEVSEQSQNNDLLNQTKNDQAHHESFV